MWVRFVLHSLNCSDLCSKLWTEDVMLAYTRFMLAGLIVMTPLAALAQSNQTAIDTGLDYRVLATLKTSTLEKELNEAAEAGFRFNAAMGGKSAFGGKEVIVVMSRVPSGKARYAYKLLATSKTSTMEKELQQAADAGFEYAGQTVFESSFGGDEVVVILQRDKDAPAGPAQYKLFATSRTSTLEKELLNAGRAGYEVLGLTVAETAFGGKELVAIARRLRN
jgi:hypothetical protein